MTSVKQVRKILGKLADNVSDEELGKELKAAELLKVLFFNQYTSNKNSKVLYNKNTNGKS